MKAHRGKWKAHHYCSECNERLELLKLVDSGGACPHCGTGAMIISFRTRIIRRCWQFTGKWWQVWKVKVWWEAKS